MSDRIPRSPPQRLLAYLRRKGHHPALTGVASSVSLTELAAALSLDSGACARALDGLVEAGALAVLIGEAGRLEIRLLDDARAGPARRRLAR